MDNGYPQTTEVKILSKFITTESHKIDNPFQQNVFDIKMANTLTETI